MYSLFNSPFDPFPMFGQRSVYVISDSELAKYKARQAEAELLEIDKLIDAHKQSIERLEATKAELQKELPVAEWTPKPAYQRVSLLVFSK